jgi:long-chain-fatty-acid--CoA ligase ACSBG
MQISEKGLRQILEHHNPEDPLKNVLWTTDYRRELPIRGFNDPEPVTIP